MANDDLCSMSLAEAARAVRWKSVSPVELTTACLERIAKKDPEINSFISVFADEALDQARKAEFEITRGEWRGPLHGIPVAVKDLIDIQGKVTTAASAGLQENVATEDAEVVRRLRCAGVVILGKNNLHEFAYGGSGVISHFGPVRNPVDAARITGGSSSGSAAAVAAGFCFASIGTDTAGSIRLPAACCGVVGLKPAYGRVSANGVVPLSWSYDHVGPLTRTVDDAFLVLAETCDWRAIDVAASDLRIGVARRYFFENVEAEIAAAVETSVASLAKYCRSVQEVSVPVDEDRTFFSAEAWAFHQPWVKQKPEMYQPQTLERIRPGERYSLEQVQQKRHELETYRASVNDLFREVDIIVTPTAPILPPTFQNLQRQPETLRPKELLMLRNTRPWNVYGVPSISVPCGRMMGVQLSALYEETLLAAARLLSEA
jgi:aspartyl-tRNA(Asn)/glutamyl-tRNA(Gln) amidotransferase subunit A